VKILVAAYHLYRIGGSEIWTHTLCAELMRRGHDVSYCTWGPGEVSHHIEHDLGVKRHRPGNRYDIAICSHKGAVDELKEYSPVQVCHGIYPEQEQPSSYASAYVAVSDEVRHHLMAMGHDACVVNNFVDCDRFSPVQPVNSEVKTVVALTQGTEACSIVADACREAGWDLKIFNKYFNATWDMPYHLGTCDIVISIGRGVYEAMACGRPVVSFDSRDYSRDGQPIGDGYIGPENLRRAQAFNFSGRGIQKRMDVAHLIREIRKYNPLDGPWLRYIAKNHFSASVGVDELLRIATHAAGSERTAQGN